MMLSRRPGPCEPGAHYLPTTKKRNLPQMLNKVTAVPNRTASIPQQRRLEVESLRVKLRNEVADQLGATRGMFGAGTIEMPIRMVQSGGDAVVLSVAAHELWEVLVACRGDFLSMASCVCGRRCISSGKVEQILSKRECSA
jgi:hypothetical protein